MTSSTHTGNSADRTRGVLRRAVEGRMLAGVAAGAADYFDVDLTALRIAFVALAFLGGVALPLYLAAWLLIPEQGTDCALAEELVQMVRVH